MKALIDHAKKTAGLNAADIVSVLRAKCLDDLLQDESANAAVDSTVRWLDKVVASRTASQALRRSADTFLDRLTGTTN